MVVRTGPNGEWLDREYHPRGVARWGARARLVGQDANDPRYNGKGATPQQRALMAAAAESLANAKELMIAGRETIQTTEVLSTEQLVAARKQLGGKRTQRKAASAAANTQLEAATAQLAQAEVEFAAAAKVGNALNPSPLALPVPLTRHIAAAKVGNTLSQAMRYYKLAHRIPDC